MRRGNMKHLITALSILVLTLVGCAEKKHLKCDCQCEAAEEDSATFEVKDSKPTKHVYGKATFRYGDKVKVLSGIYEGCLGEVTGAKNDEGTRIIVGLDSCPRTGKFEFYYPAVEADQDRFEGVPVLKKGGSK